MIWLLGRTVKDYRHKLLSYVVHPTRYTGFAEFLQLTAADLPAIVIFQVGVASPCTRYRAVRCNQCCCQQWWVRRYIYGGAPLSMCD